MANMKKLKGIMAENGYTQNTLAQKIGMSRGTFNMKINGKYPFTVDEACKICDILCITDSNIKCHIFLR